MRYRLRTLLIVLAIAQIVASIVAAKWHVTPMAMVGCYAVVLLLAVGSLELPPESSRPFYRMIAILAVILAAGAILVELAIGG